MTITGTARQGHCDAHQASTCVEAAKSMAVENWSDANPGVDPYAFSSYDTDNGGTYGAWDREMDEWARQYVVDDMIGCEHSTEEATYTATVSAFYERPTARPEGPTHVRLTVEFDRLDVEAAERFVALFPKSAKLRVTTLSGLPGGAVSYIRADAKLGSDGVNGGVNETGIKRYRTWIKAAEKAGITLVWSTQGAINAYRTREAFESAIA